MFITIFRYELSQWFKKPSIYLYFSLFFGLAFISFAGAAGFFDPPLENTEAINYLNAPKELNFMFQYFNRFFLFLLPAIIGLGIFRDFGTNTYQLLYSFPIKKSSYLFGKFLSALSIVFLITSSAGLGILLATQLPNLNPNQVADFQAISYLQIYISITLPNMFIIGSLVFTAVLWTRNIYAGFAIIILAFLYQILLENLLSTSPELLALLDPFAQHTIDYLTHQWDIDQQKPSANSCTRRTITQSHHTPYSFTLPTFMLLC